MSNPCINRWGLNTFWHHFWFSDSRYALYLQQDKVFLDLVQVYLLYGSTLPATVFRNKFWRKPSTRPFVSKAHRYFRWVTLYDPSTGKDITYRLRDRSDETFQARASLVRLGSWIVLNLYWFQPDKGKNQRDKKAVKHLYTNPTITEGRTESPSHLVKLRAITTSSLTSPTRFTVKYSF